MFVSVFAQHRIEQVSFSIYRPIEISPTTIDLDVVLSELSAQPRFLPLSLHKMLAY
jgi:hypothetical protein